jgi:hypothetical protein
MTTFPSNQPTGTRHTVGVRSWQLDPKGRWAAAAYVGYPRLRSATVYTANTALDGSGSLTSVFTAGPQGSQVSWLAVVSTGDPADSILNVFVDVEGAIALFDQIDLDNPAAASTVAPAYRTVRSYANGTAYPDWLLPAGAIVRVAVTATPTAGTLNVFLQAKDF